MGAWARKFLPIVALSSILFFAVGVAAQTSTSTTVELGWKVLPYQSLTLTSKTDLGSRFELRPPTQADLLRGYIEVPSAVTLVAASNISWSVKVHAVETSMGQSADGTTSKPLSDFSLRANNGSYVPISAFDQTLAFGGFGTATLVVDYRIQMNPESYKPGDYGLTLVYTITTQD